MDPINRILSIFGLELSVRKIPSDFRRNYKHDFQKVKENSRGFNVSKEMWCEIGVHPENHIDHECGFAAYHINRLAPKNILDIGSYRHFILGVLSNFRVTTVDVRDRKSIWNNESVVTCDAKNLKLPDNSFDLVISLSALAHFGLGRYGDSFDLDADKKAFSEMMRVLQPKGHLIFSTNITRAHPSIAFNAHRVYSYEMIRQFCADLICEEERFYIRRAGKFSSLKEVTTEPNGWDMYCGCWQKKAVQRT